MDKVILFFNSELLHFSQLFTGLEFLKEENKIQLDYVLNLQEYPVHIFRIDFNGHKIFFDMGDSPDINWKLYEKCDFYVKRMLLESDIADNKKLIPFGLNYQVFLPNKFLKFLFLKDRHLIKYSLRYSKMASKILKIKDCVRNNNLSNMESKPASEKQIIFRARLWNPDNNSENWKKRQREILNSERISINRKLKKRFRENFKGGIQHDKFSEKICSDLLLPEKDYHKRNYIKELQRSGIGVLNQGLEESISWKMGEYVAHSLAIVTSPIGKFHLPGDFKEGENYLQYESVEECIEKTEVLFKNDRLRNRMQRNNEDYYLNYLHPGANLDRIFSIVMKRDKNFTSF